MKMKIELRSDHVEISGYVNAVGRDSRPITSPTGRFVEQVEPGVFRASMQKRPNVNLLLNHNENRKLGSTDEGNLTLTEDNIGLRATAIVRDAEVIDKARKKQLRGWSFGMYVNKDHMEQRADNIPRRNLQEIDMFEVSLIDDKAIPCYAGTSVECRSDGEKLSETRSNDDEIETVDAVPPGLSEWEQRAALLAVMPYESKLAELRYNPYHNPTNGRFTSGGGGMSLYVGKG